MEINGPAKRFRLGFLINPFAGVGGPAGLKGSDAHETQQLAKIGALQCKAAERASIFFSALMDVADKIDVQTIPGAMGSHVVPDVFMTRCHQYPAKPTSDAEDTRQAVMLLQQQSIDLLVFVGGDGTARDVCQALHASQPALGIPAGVKMQSAVYGIHPSACAAVVKGLIRGEFISLSMREVRDLDEAAYRLGIVRSQFYGEMCVPEAPQFVQNIKQGGLDVDEHILLAIADDIAERIAELSPAKPLIIFAPGSTTYFIQQHVGMEATLLGVDVLLADGETELDLNAEQLHTLIDGYYQSHPGGEVKLILTAIGGQGHIIGRGNQQISSRLLNSIGKPNLWVVAAQSKLTTLAGRPLLMDSGDAVLDAEWSGFIPVITGYREQIMYRLGEGRVYE